MEKNNYKCLRCDEELPNGSMPQELCIGCKYDFLLINNERIREYANNNYEVPFEDQEAFDNPGRAR